MTPRDPPTSTAAIAAGWMQRVVDACCKSTDKAESIAVVAVSTVLLLPIKSPALWVEALFSVASTFLDFASYTLFVVFMCYNGLSCLCFRFFVSSSSLVNKRVQKPLLCSLHEYSQTCAAVGMPSITKHTKESTI